MIHLGGHSIADPLSITLGGQQGIQAKTGKSNNPLDVHFPNLINQYDHSSPSVVLSAGRWNDQGNEFGENVVVTDDNSVHVGPGAYTQLIPMSEDTSSVWSGLGPWTQIINLSATGIYTISTNLSGATITVTAGTATIDAGASTTYGNPEQFEVTATGTVLVSTDTANPKAQLTLSNYKLPYAKNNTTGAITTSDNYANAAEGIKYQITGDILDALDGKANGITLNSGSLDSSTRYVVITTETDHFGSGVVAGDRITGLTTALDVNNTVQTLLAAQGKMTVEWTPEMNYTEVVSDNYGIISCLSSQLRLIYFDELGQIKLYDGTNTASTTINYQAGIKYTITAQWGNHPSYSNAPEMQITVTDGTTTWQSLIKDFDGSFDPGDYLSLGWDNEYWQKLGKIVIEKDPRWQV